MSEPRFQNRHSKWTAFVCPICLDGPNLGPVSGREWSCGNGHPHEDAIQLPVVPCDNIAVERAIDAYDELVCPTCDGEGKITRFLEPETLSGIAEVECDLCMGSGDPYPELVVRTILRAAGRVK